MSSPYTITAAGTFARDFRKLDKSIQERIDEKICWAAAHTEALRQPLLHMPKDLQGLQKLRVGDYRILFWADHAKREFTLYAVGHRSTIYRTL